MTPLKKLQASTGTHYPFFDYNKIWPTLIFSKFVLFGKSPKLPVHALNHYLQKRKLQAPTRAHDLLFWPKKIWPTLLFPRFTPENTFPKFPVHTLINDPPPPKKKLQASTRTHDPFLTTQKFDSLSFKYTKNTNLENMKVGQISFLNLATFKSAQVPWTYFYCIVVVDLNFINCFNNRSFENF